MNMRVREVIERLSAMPPEAEFLAIYDGFCGVSSDTIWLSRSGQVLMGGYGDPLYHEEDYPEGIGPANVMPARSIPKGGF